MNFFQQPEVNCSYCFSIQCYVGNHTYLKIYSIPLLFFCHLIYTMYMASLKCQELSPSFKLPEKKHNHVQHHLISAHLPAQTIYNTGMKRENKGLNRLECKKLKNKPQTVIHSKRRIF